ncbi:MAG: hypothetical protein Ta2B_17080 [Termitinemataceae bacterium]|nr:MAG: hypothetical protein Ta2B_17080 [Termitinemataceae bacterium]
MIETKRWLKWNNDIIGVIDTGCAVHFTSPNYNKTVSLYTGGVCTWSPEQFIEFLSERVVSRERRDIEHVLFRCGLSQYDVLKIAQITRGIHPKDLIWIAHNENESFKEVITDVFVSVFHQRIDLTGDSIDTPEGCNIKRYGVYNGKYGIYKQRINQFFTDVESEVAVFHLAKRLGVPCCPAYRTDKDIVFSQFLFDFSHEYIVHFRRLFDGERSANEYQNLISVRPEYTDDIARMILLDFITRQDDRHLSNIAIIISGNTESFYPLYDNGRSLFYEDTEETVKKAVSDQIKYVTNFGYSGTYWDYCLEIAQSGVDIGSLINLNVSETEVAEILQKACFSGYRFEGALQWIMQSLAMLK